MIKAKSVWILCASLMVNTGMALAYEVDTHEKLSEAAHNGSVIATDPSLLPNLGIKSSDEFLNSKNEKKTVVELIKSGSRFEDNLLGPFLRVRHHFYDPLYDRPLTVLGVAVGEKSPDWALEDRSTINSQEYSLRDARDYLYKALTGAKRTDREKNFGRTFETLGHVIHHLQDMAQPQHVRNDIHPNVGSHKSLYEEYTNRVRDTLPLESYRPVVFDSARKFWHNAAVHPSGGSGLAEFANINFLSAGTLWSNPTTPAVGYPSPRWNGTAPEAAHFEELLFTSGVCPPPGCRAECGVGPPACALTGEMLFYATDVVDNYTGATDTNPRAATLSILDQDLTPRQQQLFALNRFNFEAAYPFLIPKAVAYSADLIDHFFRGRLGIEDVADDGNQLRIEVRNLSGVANSFKDGVFELYYDAADGARKPLAILQGGTVTGLANDSVWMLVAEKPKLSQIDLGKEAPLVLVYRGTIGQEQGLASTAFQPPLSGFLVEPNYTPADGITGRRHIYNEDGQWKLSPYAGLMAGNIDWKGWYEGGRPTKVLSWNGPDKRYSGVYGFSTEIYRDGRVFARAPQPVLGAALARDDEGRVWLIVICNDGAGDSLYRRPARRSDSSELYDPVSAPDGWQLIAARPSTAETMASPWFFSANGKQAQTMRAASIGPSRLTLHLSENISSASFGDSSSPEGATFVVQRDGITPQSWPPSPPCPEPKYEFRIAADWTATERGSGTTHWAVDYDGETEVIAVVSTSHDNSIVETYESSHSSTTRWLNCSPPNTNGWSSTGRLDMRRNASWVTRTAASFGAGQVTVSERTGRYRLVETSEVSDDTVFYPEVASSGTSSHRTEYLWEQSSVEASIGYIDLRHGLIVAKQREIRESARGAASEGDGNAAYHALPPIHGGWTTRYMVKVLHGARIIPAYSAETSHTWDIRGVHENERFIIPKYIDARFSSFPLAPYSRTQGPIPFGLSLDQGISVEAAIDALGRLCVSVGFRDVDGAPQSFDHLDGGSLSGLLPGSGQHQGTRSDSFANGALRKGDASCGVPNSSP